MSVTGRFVAAAGIGVIVVLVAWAFNVHTFAFFVYNGLLAGLLVIDFVTAPKPAALTVTRMMDEKLFFKTTNTIRFTVSSSAGYPLPLEAKDETNRHFSVVSSDCRHTIPPGETQVFTYTVIPAKRGSFSFEWIFVRYRGPLGLCVRHADLYCPVAFKVYPNLRDLGKYRLMVQKNRLLRLPQGDKAVRVFGTGAEFERMRVYVEGDDYRKMNWKATARENKLIVNCYQAEKNQPVFVMLDAGRPMSYSVGGYKKLDYAINAALIVSDIVNQQGDNSGLVVFDTEVRALVMPGKGAAHRNQLMETLYHVSETRTTSDYERAFQTLCERQNRRSLVFIFTDFESFDEAESMIQYINLLKQHHFPIVVFMRNESLLALTTQPDRDIKDRLLRETAQEFLDERARIFRRLNALRIPNVETDAESFTVAAVNRYLAARAIQ